MNIPISFEFFPPNTPVGQTKLATVRAELAAEHPEFFSVTYGAGGSAQPRTLLTVREIAEEGHIVAPHLSTIGGDRAAIRALLEDYKAQGIRRLVALRGDLPAGEVDRGDLPHASDLVRLIRETTGDWFHIEVAAYPEVHPQASSPEADLDAFAIKIAEGANSAITQYFFNPDAYFHFRDAVAARGISAPVAAGIMPITNFVQLARFSDNCGAEIPRWIRMRLAGFGDDLASIRAFGLEVVSDLCRRLIDGGVPALHFYTLNQAGPTREIVQQLRFG